MRPASETAPPWVWLASWALWLSLFAVALLSVSRAVERHRDEHREGERAWQLRVEICKHLSQPPRPRWPECHERAKSEDANLLSASSLQPTPPAIIREAPLARPPER